MFTLLTLLGGLLLVTTIVYFAHICITKHVQVSRNNLSTMYLKIVGIDAWVPSKEVV